MPKSQNSKPPTEGDRLRMFLSATDDYEEMAQAFPLPTSVAVGSGRGDPATYWLQIMHASLLRKFFQGADELNLGLVYKAMDTCAAVLSAEARETLDGAREKAASLGERSVFLYVTEGNIERGEAEVTIDELYGRHLHGDYDRWRRSESGQSFGTSAAMHWNMKASSYLRMTRDLLDLGLSDGSFDLDHA